MTLRLTLENVDRLPDGGPVSVSVKERGLEIGRHTHLDWTLPDPERVVSGKHCEVRYQNGEYWLFDLSKNGTFVNGSDIRLSASHPLRDGDRIMIGPYIVAVEIQGAGGAPRAAAQSSDDYATDPWGGFEEIGPPDDAARSRRKSAAPFQPDWIDAAANLPPPASAPPPPVEEGLDWTHPMRAPEPPPLAPPSPPPPMPAPRRPTPKAETPEAKPLAEEPRASAAPNSDALPLIANAAGLSPTIFDGRNADEVAVEIGALMRITTERLTAMLHARDETRSQMRSASPNAPRGQAFSPLEFGDPRDALGMMFGPRNPRYLDARAAVEKAFSDLEMHHMLVFAAMRATLERLFVDLAPERIEASIASDRGLGALLASRKAQLWDIYVERWRALSRRSDGRLSEAFWALIGEAYDRLNERGG